jgi:hypothetical protein
VADDYPRRSRFSALTKQEEKSGLLDQPETIGSLSSWDRKVTDAGFEIRGHRLIRRRQGTVAADQAEANQLSEDPNER